MINKKVLLIGGIVLLLAIVITFTIKLNTGRRSSNNLFDLETSMTKDPNHELFESIMGSDEINFEDLVLLANDLEGFASAAVEFQETVDGMFDVFEDAEQKLKDQILEVQEKLFEWMRANGHEEMIDSVTILDFYHEESANAMIAEFFIADEWDQLMETGYLLTMDAPPIINVVHFLDDDRWEVYQTQ